MPSPPVQLVSDEEFLQAFAGRDGFEVEVDGDQQSFLGKARCAYWEWIYGTRVDGKLASWSIAYASEAPLQLLAGGKRTSMPRNRVRVYAAPSWEKELEPGDQSAPEVVQRAMAAEKTPIYVAEFRLEAGKRYHALVHRDAYHLPPQGPGKPPRSASRTVLRLSDKPFEDGKPASEITPAYKGWTY